MAFAVTDAARLSLSPARRRAHLTTRQASLDATDRSVAPPKGLSTLGFDPARFQTEPPACYRASWQLPGPDSHRQATTSLSTVRLRRTSPPNCRSSPPSSGTPTLHLHTGTCRHRLSSSRSRATASNESRGCHESARTNAAGVLHRPADHPDRRQPENDRRLPRHVPTATRVHRPTDRQTAIRA